MQRRELLTSATALALGSAVMPMVSARAKNATVVDAHIHLFDPTRAGGVPWPEKNDDVLYHAALPGRYAQLAEPCGVVGAIAVECSPWMVDNFWLHDVVERNPIMLGYMGDLLPEAPDFGATLDRLHRSSLFLGLRYGNLWGRDLGSAVQKPEFVSGLKLLAQMGLVLETANPDPALIGAVLKVSDVIPDLRIVIDHLPHADPPADGAGRADYEAKLHELSQRPNVFVKGSEIVRRTGGRANLDPGFYKATLDQLWNLFGEDRIFFGSDWPNSDSIATYAETFHLANEYLSTRGSRAKEKYFWKNSAAVYKWRARSGIQARPCGF